MKTLGSQGPCRITIDRAALTLSSRSKHQRYAMRACWPRVAVLASWAMRHCPSQAEQASFTARLGHCGWFRPSAPRINFNSFSFSRIV
jgi:hypothetical protein